MASQLERDEAAGAAREDFLYWYGGLGPGQVLEQRVSQEADADGVWLCEFMVSDADGSYGWFGYEVERVERFGGWHCDQIYEADSLLKSADDVWTLPAEGPSYAAERAAAREEK